MLTLRQIEVIRAIMVTGTVGGAAAAQRLVARCKSGDEARRDTQRGRGRCEKNSIMLSFPHVLVIDLMRAD